MSNRRAEVFPYGTIWEATWGRIMTLDQLKRRGWKIPNRCYMCKEEEEMIDYIHLYSLKAGFAFFGVHWVMHYSVGYFFYLTWVFFRKKEKKALEGLLHCACFGPFGGREIGELLIIVVRLECILGIVPILDRLCGLLVFVPLCHFLAFWLLCICCVYLLVFSFLQYNLTYLSKKEKKKENQNVLP